MLFKISIDIIILLRKSFLCFLLCIPGFIQAQVNREAYDTIKDTIVAKFNRGDYVAIYQLFDTSFSKRISQNQLVNFLKGNQNSGKIVTASFIKEDNTKLSYQLEFELRNMIMDLQLTDHQRISNFGLKNAPMVMLSEPPLVKSNNPKISALDIAIDSVATAYFKNANANSLVIGIIKNGKKHIYLYGETERGNKQLPTSTTLYEIGSITKTFTTTILAQAVLDKKVDLKDDIRKYLPGNYENLSFQNTPITLRDLANHSSRLPAMPADIGEQPGYNPVTPEAHYDSTLFYKALKNVTLDTVPGTKFLYSNWGTAVLGHILEKVYKQSLAQLIKRYITDPLKMKNTLYLFKEAGYDIAYPHSENGKRLPKTNLNYFSPAGGLSTTVNDMLNFMDAQIKETNSAITLTHIPTANNMGLGWGVRKDATTRHLEHNGSEQGSTAHISIFPELNSGCVIFVNNRVNLGRVIGQVQRMVKGNE